MAIAAETLQSRLEDRAGEDGPLRLLARLEASGRFHRDSGLGRIFHPGRLSLRERRPSDSLHVVVHGDHIAAHVDRLSPLGTTSSPSPYSFRRAAGHNLAGMIHDLGRLVRGRQGDHRCALDCQWVWDDASSPPDPDDLLDPAAHAWSVQLEARVRGRLDEARLRAALARAAGWREGHVPLLCECPDDDALAAVRDDLLRAPAGPGDQPPLAVRLARHPGGDVVMLNVNHAAADGPGALGVLRVIAAAYAGEVDVPAVDFLSTSDVPVRPAGAPESRLIVAGRTLVERLRDALARPARLAPDGAEDRPGYGFHHRRLTAEETRGVVDAQRAGSSRDRLLAGLHLAVGEWNRDHGAGGHRVGVLVPVDLRSGHWRDATVGNFSVTARVSTGPRHRTRPEAALRGVGTQGTRNRRTRTGVALIAALDRAGLLALWARQSIVVLQPLTRHRYVDTALLANLGWLDRVPTFGADAGGATELWFSVPARSPVALCVGAATVSGRLHLVLRHPYRMLGPDAARRFMDLYLAQLRRLARS